ILEIDTVNDAFIKDVNNELQITLKSLLNGIEVSSQLIGQITEPKIVKIHSALSKKKIKSFTEKIGKKVNVQESNHDKQVYEHSVNIYYVEHQDIIKKNVQ
ncbi:1548_t:CDS:2, partial [Gigaspora margarita]